jgi:hypothetical protein
MSLCKIGDRWSSVDVILVVEFFSSKIIWFQLEWDKADTVNVSFEERKHIREVLLKDKRFVALGENVILQF